MNRPYAISARTLGRGSALVALVLLAATMSGCMVFVHPAHRVRWAEGDPLVRPA
jgi:hypothetical protein